MIVLRRRRHRLQSIAQSHGALVLAMFYLAFSLAVALSWHFKVLFHRLRNIPSNQLCLRKFKPRSGRYKNLASTGKSAAYIQRRKFRPARETGRGLFVADTSSHFAGPVIGRAFARSSESQPTTSCSPEKTLPRRANHRHIFIIARISKPAPGNWPRAF
jgi:hypothetical protein